ncbi:hypothetical protein BJ546DRAFT_1075356 [Cryomyces antarcticus]
MFRLSITIGGGYVWGDVYEVANEHDVSAALVAGLREADTQQLRNELAIAPLTAKHTDLIEEIALIYGSFPSLSSAGLSDYGYWSTAAATPLFTSFYAGYVHRIKLAVYDGTFLFVSTTDFSSVDYAAYYRTHSGIYQSADAQHHCRHCRRVHFSNIVFVGGGAVAADASDPCSGINPAWRTAYVHNIVARGWAPWSSNKITNAVHSDITNVKVKAMQDLAPDTGCYMNEADYLNPDWKSDFHGESHYAALEAIRKKHDPAGTFYCPTRVGSEDWAKNDIGVLVYCQRHSEVGNKYTDTDEQTFYLRITLSN